MIRGMGLTKGGVGFLLMLVFFAPPSVFGQSPDQATKLYRGGQLDQAQQVLLNLPAEQRQDPQVLLLLGRTERTGERSRRYLQEAISRGTDGCSSEQARLLTCKYEFCRGMHVTTVDLAGELEEKFPHSEATPEALWISGCSLLALEKRDSARIQFNRILSRFPQSAWAAWARLGVGDCFLGDEDYDQTVSAYHQILDYDKDSEAFPFALSGLMECHAQLGDPERALLYHNLLMERFPRSAGLTKTVPGVGGQPKEPEDEGRAEQLVGARYAVQLGVFGVRENALRLESQFEKQRHPVSVRTKVISGKKYWVVQVGSFGSYREASDLKQELETQTGGSYRVVIR